MSATARAGLAATRRDRERDLKARARQRLAELREALSAARKARAERTRAVRASCKAERTRLSERAKLARQRLTEAVRELRAHARQVCSASYETTHAAASEAIQRAVATLGEERAEQARLRVYTRKASTCAVTGRTRAGERRAESDCEVRANLESPELLAAWERVRGRIKATARMTRTEAFLQWAHDHPGDVERYAYDAEEQAIAQLVREEERQRRALEGAPRKARARASAQDLVVILADVPF